MLLVINDFLNRRKENGVVEVNQVYLVPLLIIEGILVAVETEDELIVVVEDFLKSEAGARTIDAEDTANRADNDLIYPMILQ